MGGGRGDQRGTIIFFFFGMGNSFFFYDGTERDNELTAGPAKKKFRPLQWRATKPDLFE